MTFAAALDFGSVAAAASVSRAQPASPITVRVVGARVAITPDPFRMAFYDGAGRMVLQEVAPSVSPTPLEPRLDPSPLGIDGLHGNTRYAPLSFLVGAARDTQMNGFLWQGNELAGTAGGVMYAATRVLAAQAIHGGEQLTVATDDPSGRTLRVDVTGGPGVTVRVRAVPSVALGVAMLTDSFTSGADESFHGFGGRHNAIDEHGRSFYGWVEEENLSPGIFQPPADAVSGSHEGGGEGQGGYLFPNGPTAAYNVQNLFVSSRPYGFLLSQSALSGWRLDSDRPGAWQVAAAAPLLDYTVAPGDPATAVGSLNAVTGRTRVPPAWALGAQDTRLVGVGEGSNAAKDEAYVRDDLAQIARHRVPITAYDMFGWQAILRQSGGVEKIRDLIARFHALGIHVTAYFPAFVDDGGSGYTNPADFHDAVSRGLVTRTLAGTPYLFSPTPLATSVGALLDFTNPATVQWWEAKLREALDLGFDGFMQDFGEQVTDDMVFADGRTGAEMHNLYPVIYHEATRRIFDSYERQHPDRQLWFYTRSGFSGGDEQPGSMSYDNGNFPGDNDANWTHANGLASAADDMLNRGIGGAFGYSTDVGGYSGTTTKELLIRWTEWAALSPYLRVHNSDLSETHQPWDFDKQTIDVFNYYARMRTAVAPLIERLWQNAVRTGIPVARPLWFEYPHDPVAARQEQEWTLGPDVLVAPVVDQGASARAVYFPAGCWQDPVNDQRYRGGRTQTIAAPLGKLSYFFACGTRPFNPPSAHSAVAGRGPVRTRRHRHYSRSPRRRPRRGFAG